ncbi:hypothetical protein ACEV6G_02190 [Enterobacter ludwigii]|uniref:hypothetical protein n=1 Tax=Enterobacter ludwigii TaxID=299767 RepID=UPI003B9E8097
MYLNQYAEQLISSFISVIPIILIILLVLVFLRGPLIKFISRNLLDSGKDRYSSNTKNESYEINNHVINQQVSEEDLRESIREVLISEAGQGYFEKYKENISKLIDERQDELTSETLSRIYSDKKIEDVITESINNSVDKVTNNLIGDSEQFRALEKETLEKLSLIKTASFLEHLQKEYDATRITKALMSNIFIVVNLIYFLGLLVFLITGRGGMATSGVYVALSCSYIGLGAFVVYMIKFCNARSLTLLSLREDFLKRDEITSMAGKVIEIGANEHHVALMQLMTSSIAIKEQKINHPYEMLLYGIKDSNIMFKGGKFEIKKEVAEKSKP